MYLVDARMGCQEIPSPIDIGERAGRANSRARATAKNRMPRPVKLLTTNVATPSLTSGLPQYVSAPVMPEHSWVMTTAVTRPVPVGEPQNAKYRRRLSPPVAQP